MLFLWGWPLWLIINRFVNAGVFPRKYFGFGIMKGVALVKCGTDFLVNFIELSEPRLT